MTRTCSGATVPFLLLVDHRAHVPRILYVRSFAEWTPFIALRAELFDFGHEFAFLYIKRKQAINVYRIALLGSFFGDKGAVIADILNV